MSLHMQHSEDTALPVQQNLTLIRSKQQVNLKRNVPRKKINVFSKCQYCKGKRKAN